MWFILGLTSDFRFLFAAVFGLLYAPLVMTGLHHMTNAIDSQLLNTPGAQHDPVAHDRSVQYRAGIQRTCHERSPEEE